MNCKVIARNIDAYVDGELPEQRVTEIESHLRQCHECKELHERAARCFDAFEDSEPHFLKHKVKDAISSGSKSHVPLRSRSLRYGFVTALAAAIMIVALVAMPTPASAKWMNVARSLQGIRSVVIEFRYPDSAGNTQVGMSGISRAAWEEPAGGGLTTDESNILVWRWDATPLSMSNPSDFIDGMGQDGAPTETQETTVYNGSEYFVFRVAAESLPIDQAVDGGEWEILVDPETQLPVLCQLRNSNGEIAFQAFLTYNIIEREDEWMDMARTMGDRLGWKEPWQTLK